MDFSPIELALITRLVGNHVTAQTREGAALIDGLYEKLNRVYVDRGPLKETPQHPYPGRPMIQID